VRGGGYGSDAWLAKITGTDPRYHFRREFCTEDTSRLSGSGRSGVIMWQLAGPGLYEYRRFCVGSTAGNWQASGFVLIHPDGGVERVTWTEALELAHAMMNSSGPAPQPVQPQ